MFIHPGEHANWQVLPPGANYVVLEDFFVHCLQEYNFMQQPQVGQFCAFESSLLTHAMSSMTEGSRSTKTALGTCLPAIVSSKNVLKESSPTPSEVSEGMAPSGCTGRGRPIQVGDLLG